MEFIEDLVEELKKDVQFVHAFAIVLNGSPSAHRSKKSVYDMLRLFGEIFSKNFWRNARIVATFYSYDSKAVKLRKADGATEEKWQTDKIKKMKEKIPYLDKVSSFFIVFYNRIFDSKYNISRQKSHKEPSI